jgi:hypothetical protein
VLKPIRCYTCNFTQAPLATLLDARVGLLGFEAPFTVDGGAPVDDFTVVVRHLWSGALTAQVPSDNGVAAVTVRAEPPPKGAAVYGTVNVDKLYVGNFWTFEVTIYAGRLDGTERLPLVGATELSAPLGPADVLVAGDLQLFGSDGPKPGPWPDPPIIITPQP